MGCPLEPFRQSGLSQVREVPLLGWQGGTGLDAARRDTGTGAAARQPDQRLWLLHRHAHQRGRGCRGNLGAHQPGRKPGGRPRCSPRPSAPPFELAEQGTRIADAAGGVTDEVWANAAKHYDEDQTAALCVRHRRYQRIQPDERHRPGAGPATTSPASFG